MAERKITVSVKDVPEVQQALRDAESRADFFARHLHELEESANQVLGMWGMEDSEDYEEAMRYLRRAVDSLEAARRERASALDDERGSAS